ncbi:MAG: NAD-dependent epimerase/dehydratase [Gammaproteobacteria bacterium]
MKILLTGATGFLGTWLFGELRGKAHRVLIVRRPESDLRALRKKFGELEVVDVDWRTAESPFPDCRDVDVIVHAATDYGRSSSAPTRTFWSNEVFPMWLLGEAVRSGIKRFVNIDTFFNSDRMRYRYLEAYSLSKRHFQEWGKYCGETEGIEFINLRLFHLYGPGDRLDKFVPGMVQRCLAGERIELTDGGQKRDFIHVTDAVAAIRLVLEAKGTGGGGYRAIDLGTGYLRSIRSVAERINALCGGKGQLEFGALPTREGEPMSMCANTAGLESMGWSPSVELNAGIRTVIDDVREKLKGA